MMQTPQLPDTVLKIFGQEAAQDFENWLETRLRAFPISAFVARQKVNVLMLERVSNLLLAGEPQLVETADHQWVWRVPVDLTLPKQGRIGHVGEIDVDAHYGEVRYNTELLVGIETSANHLLQKAKL